jgi:hypothetical protein
MLDNHLTACYFFKAPVAGRQKATGALVLNNDSYPLPPSLAAHRAPALRPLHGEGCPAPPRRCSYPGRGRCPQGAFWNLLPRIANFYLYRQANIPMSYTNSLEMALRSASAHVYRQREHGRHDQDRIDAQQWIESYGPLVQTIVQRASETPSERRLVGNARKAIRGL